MELKGKIKHPLMKRSKRNRNGKKRKKVKEKESVSSEK